MHRYARLVGALPRLGLRASEAQVAQHDNSALLYFQHKEFCPSNGNMSGYDLAKKFGPLHRPYGEPVSCLAGTAATAA